MTIKKASLMAAALAPLLLPAAAVQAADEADWQLDLRYRMESVSDDAFAEDALASTLRTRLSLTSASWKGWYGLMEFEDVRSVLLDDDYNSTANGKVAYPVVADPADTELNRLFLAYGLEDGSVKLGRQRINLDNQRFFGAVGFRQNEQTFDGALLESAIGEEGRITAGYLTRANRIFGAHHPNPALANTDMQTVIVDGSMPLGAVKLGAYAHLIDLDDNPAASHRNVGIRASGQGGDFDWRLEFANQSEYADGAASIDADYFRGDAGYRVEGIRIGLAYEVLGGDGTYAFQTPFATLHKFNGATDKFLATPADGLVDTALTVKGSAGDWTLGGAFHQFASDNGSVDYGSEIGAYASRKIFDDIGFRFEIADYSADSYSSDTTKIWLTLQASF